MKRIIAFFLTVSLVAALIVPVSATDSIGFGSFGGASNELVSVEYSKDLVDVWDNIFNDMWSVLGGESIGFVSGAFSELCWQALDIAMNDAIYGSAYNLAGLERRASVFNNSFRTGYAKLIGENFWLGSFPHAEVMWVENLNAYVICDSTRGVPFVTSGGAYAYYRDTSTDSVGGGNWIAIPSYNFGGRVSLLTKDTLSNLCLDLNKMGQNCSLYEVSDKYYVISKGNYCYANPEGIPYVARINEESYVVNNSNNYYTETSGDTITNEGDHIYNEGDTNNTTFIDLSTSTVLSPTGDINFIHELYYDDSTKTYYVDAHEEYNTENNTYISNTYLYQYHIDYTSITYIGQTEEYEETYKYYYELPDGRSSADLTKEDLEQLSLSFKDVVNYARSADDLTQRVLYHFDGNTSDASYWSYCTDFHWDYGASLTYMDEGVFGGSLYLDETTHEFTVMLPGVNDVSGDFTLQFRYYQSHTETPQADSYIMIGDTTFLTFTGAVYQDKSGAGLCSTQVGSWNEICIMRKDGVVYYYINGVCVCRLSDSRHYSNSIKFHFGTSQQTYKKLDELRFTRAAVYDAGENYTVSAVPFDSNLTLILPDGEFPLADEEGKLVPAKDNMLDQYGLSDWTTSAVLNRVLAHPDPNNAYGFSYDPEFLYVYSGYTTLVDRGTSVGMTSTDGSGLFLPLFNEVITYYDDGTEDYGVNLYCVYEYDTDYTFTVYLEDGSYNYFTFRMDEDTLLDSKVEFSFGSAGLNGSIVCRAIDDSDYNCESTIYTYFLQIKPPKNTEAKIVYMELVADDVPHFTTEYEYAVYSSGQLTESPVLAVRSALDVTSYQFGGVRPSYPEIGQVWALVENGRISSLQQYTGYAWESVDGRIWTGQRWVPYYAFDVLLLKDMYDIIEADPSQDFIYTQEGFWSWLQKAWAQMMDKLDQIIAGLSGKKPGDSSEDCKHVYSSKVDREPCCVVPGHMVYTCEKCGHVYTEIIDATGHDWVVTEHVGLGAGEYAFVDTIEQCVDPAVRYVLPDGYVYVYVVDETSEDPQTGQWLNSGVVYDENDKGYDLLTCTKCGAESKDYGDGPEESDLFDALGDFLAEGIEWLLELLTDLVDSLSGIVDTFRGYIEKVSALAGPFPAFFGAFMAIVPEDLRLLLWFALVGFVALTIWRKVTK